MDFEEFPRQEALAALKKDEWVLQEKIKGAQFSLWINHDEILGANRNRFLKEEEPYFNWKHIRNVFSSRLREIFSRMHANQMVVYGEIFGGIYSHPDVQPYPEAIPLYRNVYYSPHNDWCAFDLVIDGMFQPQWYVYQIFDELGVPYSYEILKGKIAKLLKFDPNKWPSDFHTFYNLPSIENNICGGVIFRPLDPTFLADGRRILVKREVTKIGIGSQTGDRTGYSQESTLRKPKGSRVAHAVEEGGGESSQRGN